MLSIYKASAGSGKTYRLTYEYIVMLLGQKDDNSRYSLYTSGRNHHRAILAITFTNKATDEMKRRIIHELAVLAGREPGWSDDSPYLADLMKLYNCSRQRLTKAASKALDELLYDFGFFNVSTIDAFFQTVLRTFAREAELTGNFELELDKDYVVQLGASELLTTLSNEDAGESRRSLKMKWVIDYMHSLAREGKSFNIFNRNSNLFSSFVKLISGMLDEKFDLKADDITAYLNDPGRISKFLQEITGRETILKQQASTACRTLIEQAGADGSDAINKNFWGPATHCAMTGWVKNAPSATIVKAIDDPEGVLKKNFKSSHSHLLPYISDCASRIVNGYRQVAHITVTRRNIHILGMLGDVLNYMNQYCADNNTLLLSSTNDLLRRIIADDDVPFIYERIGVWLDHYLIDEFQDTSELQWTNIKPLVSQSMASGKDCLIIGDEKQCIYRFRNSDPSLLQHKVQDDFAHDSQVIGDNVSGNTNWRSSAAVVRFNNTFFTALSHAMGLADNYSNVVQQMPSKTLKTPRGHIVFTCIEDEEASLDAMLEKIKDEIDRGYRPCDIAVLTRWSKDARQVINAILNRVEKDPEYPRVSVISDDSLEIAKSPAVKFIVSMLRYMVSSDFADRASVSQRQLARLINHYEYINSRGGCNQSEALVKAIEITATDEKESSSPADTPPVAGDINLLSIVEAIVRDYIPDKARLEQNMYISAFEDIVSDWIERGESDIRGFLKWWDTTGSSATVSSPEADNALRVLTIHKSKGLEFKCVHIPYGSWRYTPKSSTIEWFEPKGFDTLDESIIPPLIPLNVSSALADTEYREHYEKLLRDNLVDELNVTYVAYTRAVDELHVHYTDTKGETGQYITGTLAAITPDYASTLWDGIKGSFPADAETIFTHLEQEPGTLTYTVGTPMAATTVEDEKLTAVDPSGNIDMPTYASLDRRDIWSTIDIDRDNSLSAARQRGIMLHKVMEGVESLNDIRNSARRLAARGIIPRHEVDDIVAYLERQIELSDVRDWFDGYLRLVKERPIVTAEGMRIPDRIVWKANGEIDIIDFKTGEERKSYASQVRKYIALMREAGYERINGYLWYLDRGYIVKV